MPPVRRVLILAVDGAQSLDILGPVEVFHTAVAMAPEAGYDVSLVVPGAGGRVRLSNGLHMYAEPLPDPPPRHDTLVVAGGRGTREAIHDSAIVAWVAAAAARARRTTSVCTGAFLLAEAGLLSGRNATTHWRYCASLAGRHPDIGLDPDAVYVRDGDVWTSAGVTAGIDLALALVEEDVGREVALAVARELVVFLRRPGGQSQFSRALAAQQATRPALRELQAWIGGHLDADLSVAALARRANLTERSFSRAFRREVGQTPAAYVEGLRIERARILLEDGAESLHAVARATGFASAEVLRRAFHRRVGVSPAAYRERFRAAA
jgi:transcriptional regulator GlxA family with amidase domain